MKDLKTLITLLFVFTAIIFIYEYYVKKKNERILRREIREKFGKVHSNGFKCKVDGIYKRLGGNLTEITYNDLNFDKILEKMNHNMSKIGLEYFYYSIRNLILNKDTLRKVQDNRNKYKDKLDSLLDIEFQLGNIGFFKEDVLELIEDEVEIDKELEIFARIFSFTIVYIIILFIFFKILF